MSIFTCSFGVSSLFFSTFKCCFLLFHEACAACRNQGADKEADSALGLF